MQFYIEGDGDEKYYLADVETRAELEEEFGPDVLVDLPEGQAKTIPINEFRAERGSLGEVLIDAAIGGAAGMLVAGPAGLVVGGSLGTAYGLVRYIDDIEQAIEFNQEIRSEPGNGGD